jgi:hypothetical protein
VRLVSTALVLEWNRECSQFLSSKETSNKEVLSASADEELTVHWLAFIVFG